MKGDSWRLPMISLHMRGKQRDMKDRKFDTRGPATDAAPVALKQCQACSACYLSLYHPDSTTRKSIHTNFEYSTRRQRPTVNIFNEVTDTHLSKRNVVLLLHGARSGLSFHEHMFIPARERIKLGIVWRREWLEILNWCHVPVYLNTDTIRCKCKCSVSLNSCTMLKK